MLATLHNPSSLAVEGSLPIGPRSSSASVAAPDSSPEDRGATRGTEQVDDENGKGVDVAAVDSGGQRDGEAETGRQVGNSDDGEIDGGLGINGGRAPARSEGRPPARQEIARPENQEDDGTVYPGDHALDDPVLLETPARSQRQVDLEALDLQTQGFSVRQIARRQKVHPNTAFNRIKRGRQIEEQEALRAQGESLHVLASKLRQIEGAFFDQACQGDYRSAMLVLRIMERLRKLDVLGPPPTQAACGGAVLPGIMAAASRVPDPLLSAAYRARAEAVDAFESDLSSDEHSQAFVLQDFTRFRDFLTEMLPHRAADLNAMQTELREAVAADAAEFRARNGQRQDGRTEASPSLAEPIRPQPGIPPQRFASAAPQPLGSECHDPPGNSPPPAPARALTRRERKRQQLAKRQQQKETARTKRVQSASARANTKPTIPAENGDSAPKKSGWGILSALGGRS